jgi:hypothetical protein
MRVCLWVCEKEDVRGDDVGREVKSGKAKRSRLWLGTGAAMACETRQCRVVGVARSRPVCRAEEELVTMPE